MTRFESYDGRCLAETELLEAKSELDDLGEVLDAEVRLGIGDAVGEVSNVVSWLELEDGDLEELAGNDTIVEISVLDLLFTEIANGVEGEEAANLAELDLIDETATFTGGEDHSALSKTFLEVSDELGDLSG